jgi:HEAT repeat protein
VGLIALTAPAAESDPQVRASAVHALGQIADPAAKEAVLAAQNDPNQFVKDAAKIALRRL